MSGTQVNQYGIGDVNLTSMMETLDKQRRGYMQLSLTNFDNILEPKIAAGSFAGVAGTLFKFESDESITGWAGIANSTDAWVKLVPAGTSPDTVTAAFTDTAPTWSDSKQGYYGTGGSANHRYIGGLYKDGAGNYTKKYLYFLVGLNSIKTYGDGEIGIIGNIYDVLTLDDRLILGNGMVPTNTCWLSGSSENVVFDTIAPYIPNTNDIMIINGGIAHDGIAIACAYVKRINSTTIIFYGLRVDVLSTVNIVSIVDGDGATVTGVSLAW